MANTYKALSSVTIGSGGATTISFTNIPQTYTDLVVKISARAANATNGYTLTVNDTDGNGRTFYGGSGSNGSFTSTNIPGLNITSGFTANYFSNGEWYIPNYASNVNNKSLQSMEVQEQNVATAGSTYMYVTSSRTPVASPITKLTLTCSSGFNFAQHTTATLYGVFNADVSSAPATPTIGTATAGNSQASITFTGVSNAASYTMTSTPSSITATGASSPITVTGLTNGTSYSFKVKSNNPFGSSAESSASNSIIPINSSYESIATVSGTGSTAYVEFTNISSNYTHLQIRGIVQPNNPGGGGFTWPVFRLNGDASNAYTHHYLQGNGSGVTGGGGGNQSYGLITLSTQGNATNVFSGFTMDILDYKNTNKFKTVRTLGGFDNNGTGQATLSSCLWRDLSAISSIRIYANDGLTLNISANATFALYGIKVS